jgi:hypothetical protein
VPEKRPVPDADPKRDQASEDGPHSNRSTPRDSAQDAQRKNRKEGSQDVDPDSAESEVDREDSAGES